MSESMIGVTKGNTRSLDCSPYRCDGLRIYGLMLPDFEVPLPGLSVGKISESTTNITITFTFTTTSPLLLLRGFIPAGYYDDFEDPYLDRRRQAWSLGCSICSFLGLSWVALT